MINSSSQKKLSLKQRILSVGYSSVISFAAISFVRLLTNILLARFLFPEAFGLMAIAMLLPQGLSMLSDVAMRSIVIRHQNGADTDFLRTAWTIQIIRGGLLYVVSIALCYLLFVSQSNIANIGAISDPSLPVITAYLSISLVVLSFESTTSHSLARDLKFDKILLLDVFSKIFSSIISITAAILTESIYSIVAGILLGDVFKTIGSHFYYGKPRMKFELKPSIVRQILNDAKWASLSSAFSFAGGQGDKIFLAMVVGPKMMGFYYIASQFVEAIFSLINSVVGNIAPSMFGEFFRERREGLIEKYYKFRIPIDVFTFFVAGMFITFGHVIIRLLYDIRYMDSGWMLEILAVSLLFLPFQAVASAFGANGEFARFAMISMVQAVSLFCCALIGYTLHSIPGAIWGIALHRLVPTSLMLYFALQRGWVQLSREPMWLAAALVGGLLGYVLEEIVLMIFD